MDSPKFIGLIEQVLLAMATCNPSAFDGNSHAAAQQQAPRPVQLESAAGAAAYDSRPQPPDWGQKIVEAAARLRPRI